MNFRDLLDGIDKEEVEKSILSYHPGEKKNIESMRYGDLLGKLLTLEPSSNDDHMTLHVEYTKDCGSDERIWNASYSVLHRYQKKYSLGLAKLEDVLSAEVREDAIKDKTAFVAHVLWEVVYSQNCDMEFGDKEELGTLEPSEQKADFCSVEDVLNSIADDVFD